MALFLPSSQIFEKRIFFKMILNCSFQGNVIDLFKTLKNLISSLNKISIDRAKENYAEY